MSGRYIRERNLKSLDEIKLEKLEIVQKDKINTFNAYKSKGISIIFNKVDQTSIFTNEVIA
jgi:hypothetical protein